jgi:hypothetical protein
MSAVTLAGIEVNVRDGKAHQCERRWGERWDGNAWEILPRTKEQTFLDGTDNVFMRVNFGLHYIRGNRAPSYSVTVDGYRNGREEFGGCCHDIVLQHVPELADLVALHLSDIDGAPMYAEANGFYWLAGIVDVGEKYHGGSGSGAKTAMDCARIAADHFRITQREAIALAGEVNKAYRAKGKEAARLVCKKFTDAQRPRWKAEALAAVKRWQLGVYGDMHKTHAETVAMIEGGAACVRE